MPYLLSNNEGHQLIGSIELLSSVPARPLINPRVTCAVERRWSTAGASPARELGSLHPEAIGVAVEETKPSELSV